MLKLAICISGSLRSFEYCKESFVNHIIKSNEKYFDIKLFIFIPEDNCSYKIKLFDEFNPITKIKKDEIITHKNKIILTGVPSTFKKNIGSLGGLQGYLQQIKGINETFKMVENYEKENSTKFDFILRCRSDVIYNKNIELFKFDTTSITVPQFHSYSGINDRFAFGKRELMKHYMNMFPNITKYDIKVINAEQYAYLNLKKNKVPFVKINICFNRVRQQNKIENDSF